MPETVDLIGSSDAASILGVDRSTLSRWVAFGKIKPVTRVGDGPKPALIFNRADVEALAAQSGP